MTDRQTDRLIDIFIMKSWTDKHDCRNMYWFRCCNFICILLAGQCLDDTFSVTGSFKTYVPVICGDIGGQHSTYNLKLKEKGDG